MRQSRLAAQLPAAGGRQKETWGADALFYMGAGPAAAVFLGMFLIPFREVTYASNFTFAFLILTIAVAEYGGRAPAAGTALASALSLDFFLTEPYMRLSIEGKNDIVGFLGLTTCGLLVASLGRVRARTIGALTVSRRHRDLLHAVLRELEAGAPLEHQITAVLRSAREVLPLGAAVVRNRSLRVLASMDPADTLRQMPTCVLQGDSLLPTGQAPSELRTISPPLPPDGGRISLVIANQTLGWLDVWGSQEPADLETRRAAADVARVIALLLSGQGREGFV